MAEPVDDVAGEAGEAASGAERSAYDLRGRRSDAWHAALDAVLEGRVSSGLGDAEQSLVALDRAVHELGRLRPAVVAAAAEAGRRRSSGG